MRPAALGAAACALAAALAAVAPQPALAGRLMETGIADDAQLLYSSSATAQRTVRQWSKAGVDVVRIHARWGFIGPAPRSKTRPRSFDARDGQSPKYHWAALDNAISLLTAAGIRPMLSITGSGPLWASRDPQRGNPRYYPDPRAFADFAHAVAERYDGVVHRYLIWNEPNQAGWLEPQFACRAGRCTPVSPEIYRRLYRAASAQIRSVDPTAQILIGTLAPRGRTPTRANAGMRPLQFMRALGCVDSRYRRIHSGGCRRPGPLRAYGFSYHPHPIRLSPVEHARAPDDASIGDLARVEQAIDRTAAHGILRSTHGSRLGLYLTEFGYQTDPPDPVSGISPSRQAAWVQHASYLAYADPRVKNLTGYLWRDEPLRDEPGRMRFAAWQSGVYFADGRPKPLRKAFDNPFFVDVKPRRRAIFWGQVRPGDAWHVRIQRRRPGLHWATIATASTNRAGFWTYRKFISGRASYRFQYDVPRAEGPPRTVSSLAQYVR